MKSIASLLVIAVVLALLVVTNPTKQDFYQWYGNKAAASAPSGSLGKTLGNIGKWMPSFAATAYQRKSYGVCSVFSLSRGGAAYLGFGKVVFVKIN